MLPFQDELLRGLSKRGKRVAVGTDIADRPPRGSVRALLTPTALTSDEWRQSGLAAWRTPPKSWDTPFTRTVPGACGSGRCSPWFAPFPPPPPPRLAPPCSAASSVLRRDPTPLRRTRPACGLGLPGPVPRREHRRGLPVLVHAVSQRAWGLRLRGTTRRLALTSARV